MPRQHIVRIGLNTSHAALAMGGVEMMCRQVEPKVVNFAISRSIPISQPSAAPNASFWVTQIEAVARLRDRTSFMRIYDHFAPRLTRYLLGLTRNPEATDELVQETMLRVWSRADSYDSERSDLATWIFRIAKNLSVDRLRREPRWCAIDEGIEYLESQEKAFGISSTESANDELILLRAINVLPAIEARLVRMSYLEGKSHSELARELGMPLGSIKSHLRRAFSKLQQSMKNIR